MLTMKQEKFVQNLLKGMSQREAYKNSYSTQNMKDETIDSNACRLFKDSKISARYNELLKKVEDDAIMNAKERRKWLSDLIKSDIDLDYLSDQLKAMDILNKMDNMYQQKVDLSVAPSDKLNDIISQLGGKGLDE